MKTKENLLYSQEHEWVKVDGDFAYIGITDYAQDSLGDVVFVELPQVEDSYSEGDCFGTVESVKAVSDLYMPLSGTVLEVNEELLDNPALVNEQPYESWMIKIEISDSSELEKLLKALAYEEFCSKEA